MFRIPNSSTVAKNKHDALLEANTDYAFVPSLIFLLCIAVRFVQMFNLFKGKKSAAKQKYVVFLQSDVLADILRHFSRKELCKHLYQVCRQFYNVANSRHNVPITHVIERMFIETATRPDNFLNVFKPKQYNSKQYNLVRFCRSVDQSIDQLRKKPIPGPLIHFQKVYICGFLEESTLQYLRDTKESFTGSIIHFTMGDILNVNNMKSQMHYLLENVFHKTSYISMKGSCLEFLNLKVQTDGLPKCMSVKLKLWVGPIKEDPIRMLLDWLNSDNSGIDDSRMSDRKKHLILSSTPRRSITDMAFEDENVLRSDFVITFVASAEHYYCLEGDHEFTLNKLATNERLSLFKHCESWKGVPSQRAYRLWYRKVINELEDQNMSTHLQNLKRWFDLGIDFEDFKFYDFSYPY
ncbi:hypothetical protein Ddc_16890 [Ditylenchus destructor]|nr:hypothetical protein Ddc_16890 [Ditylenchus destructor]